MITILEFNSEKQALSLAKHQTYTFIDKMLYSREFEKFLLNNKTYCHYFLKELSKVVGEYDRLSNEYMSHKYKVVSSIIFKLSRRNEFLADFKEQLNEVL